MYISCPKCERELGRPVTICPYCHAPTGTEPVDFNPRSEADAQIARALQIVVDASRTVYEGQDDFPSRDYTPDELETLFFALGMAMTQLAKVPGGKEARERFYHNCKDQLQKRGREDIIDSLTSEKERHEQAKWMVKRAFGEDVDFAPGTQGYAMVKVIELELMGQEQLRAKIATLAESMPLDTSNDLDKLLR